MEETSGRSVLGRQVVRMETGEVIYEKVYMSPRPPPKFSLKQDWKRELGFRTGSTNDQKLGNYPEVPNRTNQFQIQVVWPKATIERGNSLFKPINRSTREPRKMEAKRSVTKRSIHVRFTKKLSKPKHVHLMTARVSTLKWHM